MSNPKINENKHDDCSCEDVDDFDNIEIVYFAMYDESLKLTPENAHLKKCWKNKDSSIIGLK